MNDTTSLRPSSAFSPVNALWGAVLLAGSAATSWWLVHTPAEEQARAGGFALDEADYAIEPLPLPGWAEAVIGPLGLVLALVAAVLLVRSVAGGRLGGSWGLAIGCLVPIALMAGAWWAIATAPVIGANIGAGLAQIVSVPAGLLCLAAALACAVMGGRRRR
ncbi:hypothetical protein DFP74_5252 [Nocardiopsis sp. Huas11]|uniref:hypothetical protein n=1 Tax=Nocardiopsis sp. Huas11 TaxID=2183912 RepID=UPI000EAEE9A0|nr:hypothetical protein [Nocardiopsis sp. Huas11]RKS09513.1 hypothetical protein DFP74_5252 [Nocardiopsis sp. Huas11]